MKVLITIVVILITGTLIGLGVMYSGVGNVAATEPHSALAKWVLNTTMENSVARYARGIEVPDLNGPEQLYAGITNYQEMCAGCHAPPGEPSVVARGLNPEPPDLARSAEHMSAQELFWVVKHGVKMTGKPAGPNPFTITRPSVTCSSISSSTGTMKVTTRSRGTSMPGWVTIGTSCGSRPKATIQSRARIAARRKCNCCTPGNPL